MWLCNTVSMCCLLFTQRDFSSCRKPATSLTELIKSCSLEMWKSCSLLEHLGGITGKLHYGIKWVGQAISTIPASVFCLLLSLQLSHLPNTQELVYNSNSEVMGGRCYCYDTFNRVRVSEEALKTLSTEIHQNKGSAERTTGRNHSRDPWVIAVALTWKQILLASCYWYWKEKWALDTAHSGEALKGDKDIGCFWLLMIPDSRALKWHLLVASKTWSPIVTTASRMKPCYPLQPLICSEMLFLCQHLTLSLHVSHLVAQSFAFVVLSLFVPDKAGSPGL